MEGIHVYGKGVRNVYSKGGMSVCYIEMNNEYIKGRVNGYQIVPIDGYDRSRTKCYRTKITLFK